MDFAKVDPDFITVTCPQWKRIFAGERAKDIVMDSLRYLRMQCSRDEVLLNVCALVGGATAHGNHTTPTRAGKFYAVSGP